jgi:membrane protein DedA with SNARE-associated domain
MKPLVLVALVLVLPVLLLVTQGESFAALAQRWSEAPPPRWQLFAAVAGILATDVFLPVPSGPITTLAGSELGIGLATCSAALGMTVGGVVAFGLARAWGRPLAQRLTAPHHLDRLEQTCQMQGPALVLATRALPIVAEAAVLLVGSLRMRWSAFLPMLVLSNLLVAATFATLGRFSREGDWLPAAVCLSVAIPLAWSWHWRRGKNRGE